MRTHRAPPLPPPAGAEEEGARGACMSITRAVIICEQGVVDMQPFLALVIFGIPSTTWLTAFQLRSGRKKKSLSAQTGKKTVFSKRNAVV